MEIKNKKGAVTVFIMLLFVTLTGLIFAFIQASQQTAVKGGATALASLWADSILGEYDQNLQERYNLFGFYGMPSDVVKKVNFYAGYSFNPKKYIDYQGCTSSVFDYSLANVDIFKEQVVEVGKLVVAEKIIPKETEIEVADPEIKNGIIKNEVILRELPSQGSPASVSVAGIVEALKGFTSITEGIETVGENYLENQYLFCYFRDYMTGNVGKTFFQGEIEYVICGKHSDEGNIASVKRKIVALREAMNLTYLLKHPEKSGAAMIAAELLTPGPAAIATHKAILAAWALAESYNDYKLLVNGKRIPLIKNDRTWAVDLDSILNNQANGYIDTGVDKGEGYEDYLNILVYTLDERIKLLRMMDLVQINMKFLYYQSFKLDTYNGGVRFVMTVNGGEYAVDKKYEKGSLHR